MRPNPFFKAFFAVVFALFGAWMATACVGNKVFDKYDQLPVEGWEKNDTLSFSVPPVSKDGLYDLGIGLRTTGEYPFMSLALILETHVIPTDSLRLSLFPAAKTSYKKSCPLVNSRGYAEGQGVSLYQYNFHVATVRLQAGDSVLVHIRHDMKREMLPGIRDLGISLVRNSR